MARSTASFHCHNTFADNRRDEYTGGQQHHYCSPIGPDLLSHSFA
jgi:hypothetical protein